MNRVTVLLFLTLLLLSTCFTLQAQNEYKQIPFKPGEVLTFDMYFKYGLINAKAGESSLSVTEGSYEGKDVLQLTLHAKSAGAAKAFMSVADTLSAYMSKDLLPLAFIKNAHEGKDYTYEEAIYQYTSDKIKVQTKRIRNEIPRFDTTLVSQHKIYDMVSILYYARTLDYASLEKGEKLTVSYLSGKRMETMDVKYHGLETIKANDGREYYCIKLTMLLNENAFEDKNEAMQVYITNDQNRVPIRIDSKLKKGSTRIILKAYKGVG
ncbi:DUF3108 domain-containing protein [Parabacteroides sp. PF5-9]|uniref:DUF3108 domain-containing protein n=1 Tax=Parabacteroides sp. PF5-9 TaxID=1742404 RepID=UPI0024769D38|nr:DUF3108 domain-containing protein [Parabacteroides sp. PF5-9]MDH6359085.1 hypothetical protein [Parabacteroides sp. PF5-9]